MHSLKIAYLKSIIPTKVQNTKYQTHPIVILYYWFEVNNEPVSNYIGNLIIQNRKKVSRKFYKTHMTFVFTTKPMINFDQPSKLLISERKTKIHYSIVSLGINWEYTIV